MDETPMIRHRIDTIFGNSYFMVGKDDIMLTIAEENSRKHEQLRSMTEAICRISSKAMKAGLPMLDIAEQLCKADAGRCTILSDLAHKMEEFAGKNNAKSM